MKQLKQLNYSPEDYLADARAYAKKSGYNPSFLTFSASPSHKLDYTFEGRVYRFGYAGLGDYLLYSHLDRDLAEKKRKAYLARATKIKGDWKADKHSPNNLAIRILWAG